MAQSETVQTGLRLPVDMAEELRRKAKEAERTLNGEILYRLRQSLAQEEK